MSKVSREIEPGHHQHSRILHHPIHLLIFLIIARLTRHSVTSTVSVWRSFKHVIRHAFCWHKYHKVKHHPDLLICYKCATLRHVSHIKRKKHHGNH